VPKVVAFSWFLTPSSKKFASDLKSFCPLIVLPVIFRPLSSVFRPLSSVLCLPSSVLRPLSSVLCSITINYPILGNNHVHLNIIIVTGYRVYYLVLKSQRDLEGTLAEML